MVGTESAKSKITQFIYEKFPVARKRQLGEDTPLLESGIVDSIGVLEIVTFIEQNFVVTVSDEDLTPENFGSISSIAAFVQGKIDELAVPEEAEGTVSESR